MCLLVLLYCCLQGESLLDDEDADADAAKRRLALLAAVQGDNWSGVVSQQTDEALQAAVAAGGGRLGGRQTGAPALAVAAAAAAGGGGLEQQPAGGGGAVVSPFSKPTVHRQVGEKHDQAAGKDAQVRR
jgi:hypothetical protein